MDVSLWVEKESWAPCQYRGLDPCLNFLNQSISWNFMCVMFVYAALDYPSGISTLREASEISFEAGKIDHILSWVEIHVPVLSTMFIPGIDSWQATSSAYSDTKS